MTRLSSIPLPKPQGYRCFACGTANPFGLNMAFACEGSTVCSDVVLSENHVGWESIAHGGIISTVLDEIMGWTVIAFKRTFFMTRNLEVRYHRPVPVGVPLKAIGELEEGGGAERGCFVQSALLDAEGNKLASGRSEMVFIPEKRVMMLPETYRHEMTALFNEIERLLR